MYMNECESPKISYDYQAALGEFGQVRESYQRLKAIHFFVREFGDRLCRLATVLPEGASSIVPKDTKSLRYAVRTDGKRGFLFLNNYQDHIVVPPQCLSGVSGSKSYSSLLFFYPPSSCVSGSFNLSFPKPVCYPSGNLCLWTITVPHLNLGRIFPFILKQSDEKKKRADEKK